MGDVTADEFGPEDFSPERDDIYYPPIASDFLRGVVVGVFAAGLFFLCVAAFVALVL